MEELPPLQQRTRLVFGERSGGRGWRTRWVIARGRCRSTRRAQPCCPAGEGRSPGQTKPPLTQHAGEEASPASCHSTVCMRFSRLGAGSHLQQTVCCSTYAFHSPHLLLNAFLVETPGSCCNHLPKPPGCSFAECWIFTNEACHSLHASFYCTSHPEVWPYRQVSLHHVIRSSCSM